MRRWLVRGIFGLLAIALLAGAAAVGYFWHLGADQIARGKAAGWAVEANDASLNLFEQTAAKAMFAESWNRNGFPCRAISGVAGGSKSMRISAEVARDILMEVSPERTLAARFAQVSAACQLEMAHSDAQLLRLWLKHLRRAGHEGTEAIAHELFGKSPADLNESESARMVALVYRPGDWKRPDQWAKSTDYMLAQARAYVWVGDRLEHRNGQAE